MFNYFKRLRNKRDGLLNDIDAYKIRLTNLGEEIESMNAEHEAMLNKVAEIQTAYDILQDKNNSLSKHIERSEVALRMLETRIEKQEKIAACEDHDGLIRALVTLPEIEITVTRIMGICYPNIVRGDSDTQSNSISTVQGFIDLINAFYDRHVKVLEQLNSTKSSIKLIGSKCKGQELQIEALNRLVDSLNDTLERINNKKEG